MAMHEEVATFRNIENNDVPALVAILNCAEVTRFLSSKIPSPYTEDDAYWWIRKGSKGELIKAICVDGDLVGCIGVTQGEFEYHRSGEIGYWLAKNYWRRGIATKAIAEISNYVFTNTSIIRLYASVFSGNTSSMKLLAKSGFELEAVLHKAIYKHGEFFDNHVFTKIKV